MFSIKVIDWSAFHQNKQLLERYFRLRHAIYVEERGWSEVERPIPFEVDAFDNQDAIYLIGIDAQGEIAAGSRLVPTLKPHLLASVFPHLSTAGAPRGADIFEWTRFFVAPQLRERGKSSRAGGIMLCGLLEYAIAMRLSGIRVVCEAFWPDRLEKLGWRLRRLGPVYHHRDGDIVALLITPGADALASTRAAYGFAEAERFLVVQRPATPVKLGPSGRSNTATGRGGQEEPCISGSALPEAAG